MHCCANFLTMMAVTYLETVILFQLDCSGRPTIEPSMMYFQNRLTQSVDVYRSSLTTELWRSNLSQVISVFYPHFQDRTCVISLQFRYIIKTQAAGTLPRQLLMFTLHCAGLSQCPVESSSGNKFLLLHGVLFLKLNF